MGETRLRAVMREEIALAVRTLGEVAESNNTRDDSADTDALFAIGRVTSEFGVYAYRGAFEAADEQRAADAANPFAEPKGEAFTVEMKALVQAEVLNVLKDMRDAFYGSGVAADYSIAERLDGLITARERAVPCDHSYPWIAEGRAAKHCEHCGAARPE